VYQGTWLKPQGDPIENLRRPNDLSDERQRQQLDLMAELNRQHLEQSAAENELAARINSFELAYRMQSAAPEAMDLEQETAATRKLYGLEEKALQSFCQTMLACAAEWSNAACALYKSIPGAWRTSKVGDCHKGPGRQSPRLRQRKPISRSRRSSLICSSGGLFRLDPRHLGGGIWPLADCPKKGAKPGPRSQSACVHCMAGGRRRERRFFLTAKPTR
jgi:hypothetical protein